MSAQHAAAATTAEIPAAGTGPTQLLPPVEHLRAAVTGEIPQTAPGSTPGGTAARPDARPSSSAFATAGVAGPGCTPSSAPSSASSLVGWWSGRRSPRHPVRHARRVPPPPPIRHRAGRVEPMTQPIPIPGRGKAPRHRRGGPWRAVLVSFGRMLRVPVVVVPLGIGWGVGLQVCIEAVGAWPW